MDHSQLDHQDSGSHHGLELEVGEDEISHLPRNGGAERRWIDHREEEELDHCPSCCCPRVKPS